MKRILTDEERKTYPYCLADMFFEVKIGKYTCRISRIGDETCVYHIEPIPDEEGMELIRNSQ